MRRNQVPPFQFFSSAAQFPNARTSPYHHFSLWNMPLYPSSFQAKIDNSLNSLPFYRNIVIEESFHQFYFTIYRKHIVLSHKKGSPCSCYMKRKDFSLITLFDNIWQHTTSISSYTNFICETLTNQTRHACIHKHDQQQQQLTEEGKTCDEENLT